MHTNLRRLTKRSPTKRGRCRLCSVPAGHGEAQVPGSLERIVATARSIARRPYVTYRTGSIRICAWSPQAEVQVTISISIYAESQNYPDYNWYAYALSRQRKTPCASDYMLADR
jgi:hypothetical protein